MVTMRSVGGMKPDSTLSSVVLPLPVPPETSTLSRPLTTAWQTSAMVLVTAPSRISSSAERRPTVKRRIDSSGPSSASGGMIALTREPSGRRASTIGCDSSMRRPTRLTMRSMIAIRWLLSRKRTSVCSSLPRRSTKTLS